MDLIRRIKDLATLVTRDRGAAATGRRRAAVQGGVRRRNHEVELGCSIFHTDCTEMKRETRRGDLGRRGQRRSNGDGSRPSEAERSDGANSGELYRTIQGTRTMTNCTKGFLTFLRFSRWSSRRRKGHSGTDRCRRLARVSR
jgi:hypothetical protein